MSTRTNKTSDWRHNDNQAISSDQQVADYFREKAESIQKLLKEKESKEPKETYKMVSDEYSNKFLEKLNEFIEENPDYEITDDKMYLKKSYNYAMFKLKTANPEKPKTTVKD